MTGFSAAQFRKQFQRENFHGPLFDPNAKNKSEGYLIIFANYKGKWESLINIFEGFMSRAN